MTWLVIRLNMYKVKQKSSQDRKSFRDFINRAKKGYENELKQEIKRTKKIIKEIEDQLLTEQAHLLIFEHMKHDLSGTVKFRVENQKILNKLEYIAMDTYKGTFIIYELNGEYSCEITMVKFKSPF